VRTRSRIDPGPLTRLVSGPWAGVTDATTPGVAARSRLKALVNMYVPPGPPGLPVVGRPGFAQLGSRLGAGSDRTVQYLGQFTTLAGVRHTICICGGKFYTLDWGTDTWTETLEAADFSGASITLSASSRVYSAILGNKVIFSDSTNTPWMWDGTAGSGLTELTNAPVFYGPIWVYYAKLFGVKQAERNAFVWSEEGDPTTGYEAGGYNNAWAPLGATRFFGGVGTNEAMYVHEESRWVKFTGAVSTDFQTAGTRSDVSEKLGSFAGALVTDDGVVFISQDAEPHLIKPYAGVVEAWKDCAVTVSDAPRTALEASRLVYWPEIDAVLIGIPGSGQSVITKWVVLRTSGEAPNFIGTWELGSNNTAEVLLNGANVPTFVFSGSGDGYVYEMGGPEGTLWADAYAGGTEAIVKTATTGAMTLDIDEEMHLDRCTLLVSSPTTMTNLSVQYTTPRGQSTPLVQTVASAGGDLLGLSFILGTSMLAGDAAERRVLYGWNGKGRWVEATVSHGTGVERLSLSALAINAYPWRNDPLLP
jgi:hypothetical protein